MLPAISDHKSANGNSVLANCHSARTNEGCAQRAHSSALLRAANGVHDEGTDIMRLSMTKRWRALCSVANRCPALSFA
jgi:hypothetical protein